ncbi:hypothetical protein ACFX15_044469 [Malus domestica]
MTGDDTAEKDWRLFDIWDWRFDKLPVISAKLSLRVTVLAGSGTTKRPLACKKMESLSIAADGSGKARCFSDF